MTIAERRAAERKAAAAAAETPPGAQTTVDEIQHADRGENEESR
jgi:preprotein translocase subunit SecD